MLRLAGVTGADPDGIPWVNRLVDAVRDQVGLEHGVALPVWDALRRTRAAATSPTLAQRAATGGVDLRGCPRAATPSAPRTAPRRDVRRRHHAPSTGGAPSASGWSRRIGDAPRKPWIYLIVATGDIYEDIPQAQAAAREGADVIAVIRSTGQSLLDYVPEGATREGYAGTYATQENFRLMRAALDDVSQGARPLRPAHQLRVRAVHARDRDAGRARAARHDAQRLDVRDPLPRHQPDPHVRRPALLAAGARARRHHHQHRRGQLPHHRRRRRRGAHRHRVASCSTSTSPRRPASRTGSSASGTRSRSTPTCPTRSGWSSRTPCSPASCSRRHRSSGCRRPST